MFGLRCQRIGDNLAALASMPCWAENCSCPTSLGRCSYGPTHALLPASPSNRRTTHGRRACAETSRRFEANGAVLGSSLGREQLSIHVCSAFSCVPPWTKPRVKRPRASGRTADISHVAFSHTPGLSSLLPASCKLWMSSQMRLERALFLWIPVATCPSCRVEVLTVDEFGSIYRPARDIGFNCSPPQSNFLVTWPK